MTNFTIRPFTASSAAAVIELQEAYTRVYPDAPVIPKESYASPGFEDGRNIFCAFDENGKLAGYAPLYPVLMRDQSDKPHTLWTEIKVHPEREAPDQIKDQLFERILFRARELTCDFPGHPIHLTFQYFPSEAASIGYVTSKGCQHTASVFTMRRDLSQEVPTLPPLEDIQIRPWRMESAAEQQAYVAARNECFPETPIRLGEWQYFMQSPQWAVGTTIAAFHDDQLVGNTAVFWDEAENQKSGKQVGYTEYIFVLPAWRGKNLARRMISAGLLHLKAHGLDEAHLEVLAENRNALRLYTELGYEVIRESRFYVLKL
ncbi:MAG TPA: GNAT family N-acetyltransferase [Anaerolineales bacterium]|nr:GNAT family N-acetyltransferase [Anaerolineales bacterium]